MFRIGLIQGRMLPPNYSEYQIFPISNWEEEIDLIINSGFDYVEGLYDKKVHFLNMINSLKSSNDSKTQNTKNLIKSICLDALTNLSIDNISEIEKHIEDVKRISNVLEVETLVIPFLSSKSIYDLDYAMQAIHIVKKAGLISQNYKKKMKIAFEFNLTSEVIMQAFQLTNIDNIGVCVDLGNINSLGLNPETEIAKLKERVFHIHVKDKNVFGLNVMLGLGGVNFAKCFECLRAINYEGLVTLETCYSNDAIDGAKKNLKFIYDIMKANL